MNELVLKSNKSNIFNKILNFAIGSFGVIHLVLGLTEIFLNGNLGLLVILNNIAGLGFIALAFSNSKQGSNSEMLLNDEFIQTTENLVRTRTAYWEELDKIVLTKFSIRVTYPSGVKKKLRLPTLKNEDFQQLTDELIKKSKSHSFEFHEKAWWNVFVF